MKKLIIQEDEGSKVVFTIKGKRLIIDSFMYEPYDDDESIFIEGASSSYSVPLKDLKDWLNS